MIFIQNVIAQMITATNSDLYYHIWEKPNSTHHYEVDFLKSNGAKIDVFEVKSSGVGKHESLKAFAKKYSSYINRLIVLSQKDINNEANIMFYPLYLAPFVLQ